MPATVMPRNTSRARSRSRPRSGAVVVTWWSRRGLVLRARHLPSRVGAHDDDGLALRHLPLQLAADVVAAQAHGHAVTGRVWRCTPVHDEQRRKRPHQLELLANLQLRRAVATVEVAGTLVLHRAERVFG